MTRKRMNTEKLALDHLRSIGWIAAKVENRPTYNVTVDLFGFADIIAFDSRRIVSPDVALLQVTTSGNLSSRVKKIMDSELAPQLLDCAVRIWAWGWYADGVRYRMIEFFMDNGEITHYPVVMNTLTPEDGS